MSRRFCKLLCGSCCVLVACCCLAMPTAEARISRQNPYRTYNISGVNYGSQRWERQHGFNSQKAGTSSTGRRIFGNSRLRG